MKEELRKDWAFAGFQRPRDIFKPQYRHALLLLVMVVFIGLFFLSEKLALGRYHIVHCDLDDRIPFNEYFIVFYVIWFPYWVLMLLYTMCFEVPTFKRLMNYFILTYGIALTVFFVWPSGHDLRPDSFPRENFFTWIVKGIYSADESASIFPSEHVIGAFAVVFAAADSKRFSGVKMLSVIIFLAIGITVSIVFVKQHSVLDIAGAAPVVILGYFVCFYPAYRKRKKKQREEKGQGTKILTEEKSQRTKIPMEEKSQRTKIPTKETETGQV